MLHRAPHIGAPPEPAAEGGHVVSLAIKDERRVVAIAAGQHSPAAQRNNVNIALRYLS